MKNRKKIIFLAPKERVINNKKRIHYDWVNDCKQQYEIEFWGPGYSNLTLKDLKNKIDSFKPNFIYATHRNGYINWLPDLTNITVPKIFVEVDSYKRSRLDNWYNQFDKIYSRQSIWDFKNTKYINEKLFYQIYKTISIVKNNKFSKIYIKRKAKAAFKKTIRRIKYAKTWNKTPLFRWSVPENSIAKPHSNRKCIYFIGRASLQLSPERYHICKTLKSKVKMFGEWDADKYNKILQSSSALICPTGSIYGDYVPAKLFEFAASGAAILTNCDLNAYSCSDLQEVVIPYTNLDDLESKLDIDFEPYYNKTLPIIKNHTHRIRYKELFG